MKIKNIHTWRATSIAIIAIIILQSPIINKQSSIVNAQCEKGFIKDLGIATGMQTTKEASTFDTDGNIYMAGGFEGIVQFGSFSLVSNGGYDMFIVKTSPKGEVLWATSFGGEGGDGINSIVVDSSGNIYVGGGYASNNFLLPDGSSISFAGAQDIFIAKFNSSGEYQWHKHYGAEQYDFINDLVVDDAQNLYVIGSYRVGITIGSYTLASNNPTPGGLSDAWSNLFIAKYDPSGNVIWAQRNVNQAGAQTRAFAKAFVKNSQGDIYFLANISKGSTTIDTIDLVLGGSTYSYAGDFFGKLDTSGAVHWIEMPMKDIVEKKGTGSYGIDIDSDDNIYLLSRASAGANGTTYLGGIPYNYQEGLFTMKYNKDGKGLGITTMGGVISDDSYYMYVDDFTVSDEGDVFACGTFELSVGFSGTTLTGYDQNMDVPWKDAWFCKYDSSGTFQWAKKMGAPGAGEPSPSSLHTTSDGNIFVTGYYWGYGQTIFDGNYGLAIPETQTGKGLFAMKIRKDGKLIDENFAGTDQTINKCDSAVLGSVNYSGFTYVWSPDYNLSHPNAGTTYAFPDSDTNYVLTAIEAATSCVYVDTVAISVVAPEYAIAFTASPRILSGNPPYIVEFTNTTPNLGHYDFQWDFGDGGTSSSTNPIHTFTTQGSFDITLSASLKSNGCSDSIVKSGYVVYVGIEEIASSHFSISPNPSNGEFTIEIGSVVEWSRNAETTIEIYTIDGKMVYNEYINVETRHASSKQISTDLNKGMYFIKISKGEKSFATTRKIIIN